MVLNEDGRMDVRSARKKKDEKRVKKKGENRRENREIVLKKN